MGDQSLCVKCRDGRLEEIRVALEAGEDPNSTCGTGRYRTCLMIAVDNNRVEVVALLLSCDGINVNAKDVDNHTALHYACHQRHVACLSKLLDFPGVLLNERDNQGFTPVMLAAVGGMRNAECLHLMAEMPEVDLPMEGDADLLYNHVNMG